MEQFVINIGRQLGSGGRTVGEIIARRLGVKLYDKELINLAARESGICSEFFEKADEKELRTLHKTIKKVSEDIENFSFNTSIPAFMICTNELTALKCNKRAILEPLVIALAPFAPHMAEELWSLLGHTQSITKESFPKWEEKFLVEDAFEYPVSFNGKVRFKLSMPLTATNADIEAAVKAAPESTKWLEGKEIKKMIIVPKKIVNIVIG